jgi:hypothetical protein
MQLVDLEVTMNHQKMVIVVVSLFALFFGVANAESSTSTTFSVSGSFISTPLRGVQTTGFSAYAGITHNFQVDKTWIGVEGGLGVSLSSAQPTLVAKYYVNKPGDGLNLGLGASYYYSVPYTFAEAFLRVGYEIPFNPNLSLYLIASPGIKFYEDGGKSPGGFQIPVQVGLSIKL